jgi:hypothetical protein
LFKIINNFKGDRIIMAKKTKTTSTEKRDLVKFCAFWGMVIAAVIYLVAGVLNKLSLGAVANVCNLVASIAMGVAIALSAYGYVRGRGIGWKVFYWVMLVVFIVGVVLGAL